jgi:glycosyltransferase involved in cell wall biosynthesis
MTTGHDPTTVQGAPLVSVLMSVRNGMPYVRETIDSILAQTFQDWEFVINDNASNDGTVEYIESRAREDARIRFYPSARNLGCAGGFNRAFAHSSGRWVAIIDGDDRALPNRLERQLAFVASHPDIKVASCLAHYIDQEGRRVGKTAHNLTSPEAFRRYMETNEAIGILNPGAFIDRDAFVEAGGYRDEFFPAEDIDLWARISERGMILVQPERLMEYRVHAGSSVTQSFMAARMKYEWSRRCSAARRSGRPEPEWQAFLAEWHAEPWPRRLNRWRKINAKRFYRVAAYHWISRRRFVAALEFGVGTVLQPRYTLQRLSQQVLR